MSFAGDSFKRTTLLGFIVLPGRVVAGGVETLDRELDTRRRVVVVLVVPIV